MKKYVRNIVAVLSVNKWHKRQSRAICIAEVDRPNLRDLLSETSAPSGGKIFSYSPKFYCNRIIVQQDIRGVLSVCHRRWRNDAIRDFQKKNKYHQNFCVFAGEMYRTICV